MPSGIERVTATLMDFLADYDAPDLGPTGEGPAVESGGTRYTELGPLGQGGLGVVVEAFDSDLLRCVALKRPRDDRMDARAVQLLVREGQITAQLEHPNIPAVHALGVDAQGRPFFTMTRLRGTSLAGLLAERELSQRRLLRIFLQVGWAVAFAHSRGVLHRDLKPENVMIGEFGEVRLVDWGIAKVMGQADVDHGVELGQDVEHAMTRVGAVVGSPGFAAPEQLAGEALDQRADIWALGALLYDALAGRPPVLGSDFAQVVRATQLGRIPRLGSLVRVPTRLEAVVHKALQPSPDDRYPDVPSMIEDIEAVLEDRPVSAHHEGALEHFGRWYVGRGPGMSRLKVWHIDGMAWGAFSGGIGMTMMWFQWPHWLLGSAVGLLGLVCCVPGMYVLLRGGRSGDELGDATPLREGVAATSSSHGHTTPQPRATPSETFRLDE